MGSLTWKSGGGFWNDPTAWGVVSGTDLIPQSTDDVTIAAPLNYGITVSGLQAAHDVNVNASGAHVEVAGELSLHNLNISAGTLDLTGTLDATGTILFSGGAMTTSGASVINGGTLAAAGGTVGQISGTLNHVTVTGTLYDYGTTINVSGGLAFLGAGGVGRGTLTDSSVSQGTINFLDSETLDNVNIISRYVALAPAAGTTLTLGPNVTVQPAAGHILTFSGAGAIVNYGSIAYASAIFSNYFPFQVPLFDNEGVINFPSLSTIGTFSGDFINNGAYFGNGVLVAGAISGSGIIASYYVQATTIAAGVNITRPGTAFGITAGSISPQATIEGFIKGGWIDITGTPYTFNTNAFWSGSINGGTLTIKDGATTTAQLYMVGIPDGTQFSVAPDGNAVPGVVISSSNVACFAAGTPIRTPAGEVAVERLRPGDRVVSAFGGAVPVVWTGHRRVEPARHPAPEALWPIRVAAGALGDGVPARDLLLSPEHAIYVEGHLVPVMLLADGYLIRQERWAAITYWHVELPQHDVVFAAGAACESYLDTGNRADFAGGGGAISLHPAFATADETWRALACAPQCRGGALLSRIRGDIARRAPLPVLSAGLT